MDKKHIEKLKKDLHRNRQVVNKHREPGNHELTTAIDCYHDVIQWLFGQIDDLQAKSELVDELVESFGAIAETMLDCRKAFAKGCSIVEIMTLIDQSLSVCEIQDYDSLKAILAKAKEAK